MNAATAARLAAANKAASLANLRNPSLVNGKVVQRSWACATADGSYFTSSTPCLDYRQLYPDAVVGSRSLSGMQGQPVGSVGQGGPSVSSLNWAADAWSAGLPARPHPLAPPILTNRTEEPAPYAIVLHGGSALITTEAPRQSGSMIVGRDRSGRLFSLKASEVDLKATNIQTPPAAAPAPK